MTSSATELTSATVRVVHLADHNGRLQAIFPANHMLDIAAISRITKRRLEPIASYNIAGDPLLKASSAPCIIEKSLLNASFVEIRNNSDSPYQPLSATDFQKKFSGPLSRFENISVAVSKIKKPSPHYLSDEQQMLESLGKFQSIRLKQRLEDTLEIQPLPAIASKIIQLSSNATSDMDELCDVIRLDPSLAAQVVSWASSSYYGMKGSIDSLEDAIIRVLGYDMVMSLALGLVMKKAFLAPQDGPRHYENFWFNAVSHAALMAELVKQMPASQLRPTQGHAYLAGLLHNFGYLAINAIMPPHFAILSNYYEANAHLDAAVVEMQILNFTKEQIGSWLLNYWELPAPICRAVRYSKDPSYNGEHAALANLLHLARQLHQHDNIEPAVLDKLGLSLEQAQHCRNTVQQSSAELYKIVDIINSKKN